MNTPIPFIGEIFSQLQAAADTQILAEIREGEVTGVTGSELLEHIRKARTFIASKRLKKGDRCGLLAANSIRWVAMDLALIAEGLIVVPLYSRQAPAELVAMMKDSTPSLVCCGDAALLAIAPNWPEAPPQHLFDEIFAGAEGVQLERPQVGKEDPVTIIYTSGTSGEAKGVVLTAANVGFMLDRTAERLGQLMSGSTAQERIFHYLPFTFAASWIALLTFLKRRSLVAINMDLSKIASDMRTVAPDYFLNVPQLLERMRRAVDQQLWQTGGVAQAIYSRAKAGWVRKQEKQSKPGDAMWLGLANLLVFPAIRKKMIGRNLKALICGSAPLSAETQLYFMMLGIRVLQVYGLTETTAICTMDDPNRVEVGYVGPAIPGMEMKLGDNDELLVRGPNIPRILEPTGANSGCVARWLVPYRRSGRNECGGELADRGADQELDRAGVRAQNFSRADRKRDCEAPAGSAAGCGGWKRPGIFVGACDGKRDVGKGASGARWGESGVAALQAGAGVCCGARSILD